MPESVAVAKYDKRGRVVCPNCSAKIEVPPDRYMTRGVGSCPAGHKFAVTDEVCEAVNSILAKTREGEFRKDPVKNMEASPDFLNQRDGKRRIYLP